MEALKLTIIYLLVWRLAIVLCGAMCIAFGYRLFAIGIEANKSAIEANVRDASLKLRNVAPGTSFALFGALLIGVMVVTSPPELNIPKELLAESGAAPPSGEVRMGGGVGGLVVRGD